MSISWLSRLNCVPQKQADVMSRMHFIIANFDKLYSGLEKPQGPVSLDKVSLLSILDPDLAALSKQLADAEKEYAQLKAVHREGDPMLDMALWRVETCQNCVNLRLVELEADKDKQAALKAVLTPEQELENPVLKPSEAPVLIEKDMGRPNFSTLFIFMLVMAMLFTHTPFIGQPRPQRLVVA